MKLQNINSINQTSFGQAKDSSRKSLVKQYALDTNLGLVDKLTDLYTGRKRKSYEAIKRFEKGEIAACLLHRSFLRGVDFRSALNGIVLRYARRLVCTLQNVANLFRIEIEFITK